MKEAMASSVQRAVKAQIEIFHLRFEGLETGIFKSNNCVSHGSQNTLKQLYDD